MKFLSLASIATLTLSSVSTVSAAPLVNDAAVDLFSRDISDQCFNSINGSVYQIISDLSALNAKLGQVKENDIVTLLDVNFKAQGLALLVGSTAGTVTHCGNFSTEQFLSIAPPLLGLAQPIQSSLNEITSLKPVFDHALLGFISISSLVKFDIQWLQKSVDSLGAALGAAAPPGWGSVVTSFIGSLDSEFAATLLAYKNTQPFNFS